MPYKRLKDAVRAAEEDDTAHQDFAFGRECSAAIGRFAERVANAALNSERNARLLFETKRHLVDAGGYDTATAESESELWINLLTDLFGGSNDGGDTNDADNTNNDDGE